MSAAGPADRVLSGMLLAGPVVIAIVGLAGRNGITTGLVGLYVVLLFGYVLVNGLVSR